jgi:hypothetical protein
MKVFLYIAAAFCFLSGFITSTGASTVFQQNIGGISFLMSAIYLSGGAIVGSLEKLYQSQRPVPEERAPVRDKNGG